MQTMKTLNSIRATMIVLVTAALMGLAGCKRECPPAGAEPGKVGATSGAKPRVTSPAIAELLAAVPGNAVALGFIDMEQAPWALLTGGMLPLEDGLRKTLDTELRAYVDRYLGLDLTKLQYAVGFISGPPPRGAVLLKTVGGVLKMPGGQDVEGGKLWIIDADKGVSLALKSGIVVFGHDAAVREVLETLGNKRKAVTAENPALVDWLRQESKGAALAFAAIKPKDLPLPPQIAGLARVAMRIGVTDFAAVVDGDDATISSLQSMIDQAFATGLAEIERAHQAALTGDVPPPEGAFAIIGAAYAKSYANRLKPRRDGNRLSVSIDLGLGSADPTAAVAVVGVLAAVAVPAFIQYKNKAAAARAQQDSTP